MLIYAGMNLTVREELTILTLIFIFSALTIPIIIVTSNEYKRVKIAPPIKANSEINYHRNSRAAMLINSVKLIEEINQIHHTHKIALNDIFQMNTNEIQKLYLTTVREAKLRKYKTSSNMWRHFSFTNKTLLTSKSTTIPLKVDWRDRGIISSIKSQYGCSTCWAYATISTIESMNALKTGELIQLSTQQMVECNDDNMNCSSGGDTYRLLRWLYENQTNIQQLSDFPKSTCVVDDKPGVRVKDFSLNDFTDNEHLMLAYIANYGPLLTCVNSINWENYMNGVIQQNCYNDKKYLNHAVEIVGYDLTDEVPYYIIRNTWSKRYGINGYLKIAIGYNICGIAERVSGVVVE